MSELTAAIDTTASATRTQTWARIAVALATFPLVYFGWQRFLFLTDDAFIAFRYISNDLVGRGLVWNPAPFLPVEGYTSFLWVMLLEAVWRLTGLDPPAASNAIALGFGCGTLLLAYRMVLRLTVPAAWVRWRPLLMLFVLVGSVTNRTFLTWLSSGLETSLFNFLVTWWVLEATARSGRDRAFWVARLSLSAALTALTRPDGLLFVLATGVIILFAFWRLPRRRVTFLLGAAPLLGVPVHLLWRHAVYGYWLPNTYYAKYVAAWPNAGARYLACFLIEYGVWFWCGLALIWLVGAARAFARHPTLTWLDRAIPVATLLAHLAYYTFIIGGDHFEFRVYSHLVPLLFVSAIWLVARWRKPRVAVAALVAFWLVGLPVQWTHWVVTKDLTNRRDTHVLVAPVAQYFPFPVRPVIEAYDRMQAWLIQHHIGMRHQEHKTFYEYLTTLLPTRDAGLSMDWGERNVIAFGSIGLIGWVLPNAAVIDVYGLNDRVVARTPVSEAPGKERLMAHSRQPPPGYVECFQPNLQVSADSGIVSMPRLEPLTDDRIQDCEHYDWASRRARP